MNYSHDDAGLARQPIGYWSWAAHEATVTHIRSALAEHGLTQPPWWVLNQLEEAGEAGRDRAELVTLLSGYLDTGTDGMEEAVDAVLERRLATQDSGSRLRLTPEGRALREKTYARVMRARAEIHEGIDDTEFVAALKVLQRMIHNVGGKAWHQ
ncbi:MULTISPECIES: MarR family winged helix-turn-helix transcriptional regulator [unclassified Streptomyces]|uniref:MarR family winged helix-turn-helix transcriptional regulator n=1 Tax=unclassified Streptomyces TaxID=2593676 RepID=UPI0015870BEE|nr:MULTISPECIES: MarR family winged helix-turn-helix transcriptional regulator [unclassified Streptomyces]NUV66633.1 winged helix DNA-binding protein [Streptomyces sp. CAI-121]NUV98412.1 winged helix DNA-binding protein [Streptomyces sp. CAI 127]NUW11685.1 winged helix DNA-binding protein [Streptomyces sp. CAI-68]